MLLTILGAVVLAVALCGVIAFIFRVVMKRPIPKGVLPVTAGIAMFGFMAWNENAWYSRQVAELPDSVEVIMTGEFSNFIQPWTLAFPRINRYMAVDTSSVVTNAANPNIRATEIIIAERYTPTRVRAQLVDCENRQAADIPSDTQTDADGFPTDINWFALDETGASLLAAVCP